MAISVLNSQWNSAGGFATSVTLSSYAAAAGTDRVVIVGIATETDTAPTGETLSWGGQSLTKIREDIFGDGTSDGYSSLWYILEADFPVGAQDMTYSAGTLSFDVRDLYINAVTATGVAQQAPEANAGDSRNTNGTLTANLTTGSAGSLLIEISASPTPGGSFTAGAGQTVLESNIGAQSEFASSYKVAATAGANTMTRAVGTSDETAISAAAFADANPAKLIVADSGSYALTGTAIAFAKTNKLILDSGSYSLSGTDVSFIAGKTLTVENGTFTYTGTSLNLIKGYPLPIDSGVYVETGTDTSLTVQRRLVADSGAFNLVGTGINFQGSKSIPTESGNYSVTGSTLNLTVGRVTTANSGSYSLAGTDINLDRGFTLTLDNGSYALSGTAITLDFTRGVTLGGGNYNLTGTDIGLSFTKTMVASSGTVTLTGTDVSFVYSGAPLVTASGERLICVDLENRIIQILTS